MRSNLVFTSAGEKSRHRRWVECPGRRDFDLWVCSYSGGEDREGGYEYHFQRQGSKFNNFSYIFHERRDEILAYSHVFIVDDDIEIDCDGINRLFAIMENYGLWVAQPAYSPDSHISHDITVRNPRFLLRYSNFCEVSVFAFRTDILERVIGLFSQVVSGWGIDFVIPKLLGNPRRRLAIVDAVMCRHPFRRSEINGLLKRKEQVREGRRLMARYGAAEKCRVFGGISSAPDSGYRRFELFGANLQLARREWRRSSNVLTRSLDAVLSFGEGTALEWKAMVRRLTRAGTAASFKRKDRGGAFGNTPVLIVTDENLWPPYHGFLARFFALVKALRGAGFPLVLIARRSPENIRIEPLLKSLFDHVLYVKSEPFRWDSVSGYDAGSFRKAVRLAMGLFDPCAVLVHYIWLAPCFEAVGGTVLKIIDTNGVCHTRNGFFFHKEQLCAKRLEAELLSKADVILAIQRNDFEAFRQMVPDGRVVLVPHHSEIVPLGTVAEGGEEVLLVGDNHPPNKHALSWFLERVWPGVRRARPDAVLMLCGRIAKSAVEAPGIHPVGFIQDLREAYRSARVVINPIQLGTGLKIKTVEALCYGKALVTTSCGADGLEEGKGSAFVVADEPEVFGSAILHLLEDEGARRTLESKAVGFARRHLSPEAAYGDLLGLLRSSSEAHREY